MKIKLTAAQVHDIILAHVQANCPGMEIHPGQIDTFYVQDQYDEPMFDGFSFSFSPKKNKYEEVCAMVAAMDRSNTIPAIKDVRTMSRDFTAEEYATFPNKVKDAWGNQAEKTSAGDFFGLAYSKALVESIWAANPSTAFVAF